MLTQHLGSGGSLAVLAVLVGFAVRLLRTGKANAILERFGAPPIPSHLLPWAALVLGAVGQVLDAYLGGGLVSAKAAGLAALDGVIAGALAIAGHESIVKAPERAQAAKARASSDEQKVEAKAESKVEAKAESKVEAKAESKVEAKAESKDEAKAESKDEAKAESKDEAKAESKDDDDVIVLDEPKA